ncbi:hypothetical protein Dimus_019010, partial [Dionaea muscipula]
GREREASRGFAHGDSADQRAVAPAPASADLRRRYRLRHLTSLGQLTAAAPASAELHRLQQQQEHGPSSGVP